jgi:hypothetical protein
VPDVVVFDECIKRTAAIPRVDEGKALGKKLDIQGTPTIIINGWKLGRPPTADELDGMVRAVLAGKNPCQDENFSCKSRGREIHSHHRRDFPASFVLVSIGRQRTSLSFGGEA